MAAAWLGCGISEESGEGALSSQLAGTLTPRPLPNDAGLGYYEYLPDGYGDGQRYPLIVFLHGDGERGNGSSQLPDVLTAGLPELIDEGKDLPAIVISPQHSLGGQWEDSITTPFVSYILEHYDVDLDRVYITGLSLGGDGTWDYAINNPGIPAAIVPICGPRWDSGYEALADMPIWVFHRVGDTVVKVEDSAEILDRVTGVYPVITAGSTGYFNGAAWSWRTGQGAPAAGEGPAFTVYTGGSHDAWTAAYSNQAMWDWLFTQRRQTSTAVFAQDFQSSSSVASYVNATSPNLGQLNDISAEANGGAFSIVSGRLQLARTGSTAADNDAGLTRWTNLPGPPSVLHASFDLGAAGWTLNQYQSGALVVAIGAISAFSDYNNSEISANTFHSISVKGEGLGQFSIGASGLKSASLAANGTLHHVELFLNRSGVATSYRGPDNVVRTLRNNGVALWVNGAAVITDGAAANGASSALTDLRIRWSTGDNATWSLDNLRFAPTLPQ